MHIRITRCDNGPVDASLLKQQWLWHIVRQPQRCVKRALFVSAGFRVGLSIVSMHSPVISRLCSCLAKDSWIGGLEQQSVRRRTTKKPALAQGARSNAAPGR